MTTSLVIMILKIAFVSIAVGVIALIMRWSLMRALAFDRAVRDALSRRRSLMIDWHHRCSDPNCTVPACMGMGDVKEWHAVSNMGVDQSIDTLIEDCRQTNVDDETKG